jgi:hypothetical protein
VQLHLNPDTPETAGKAGTLKLRIKYVPRAERMRDAPRVVHDLMQVSFSHPLQLLWHY